MSLCPIGGEIGSAGRSIACDKSVTLEGADDPPEGGLGSLLGAIGGNDDGFGGENVEEFSLGNEEIDAGE